MEHTGNNIYDLEDDKEIEHSKIPEPVREM